MKLQISNLSRIYNTEGVTTQALSSINLEISSGQQVMIVGESGSGKTTLLNILGLLDRGYEGNYLIEEQDVKNFSKKALARARNQVFGYIFQEYALVESETIYNNVKIPLLYSKHKKADYPQLIMDVLKGVGLDDIADKRVRYLSGGQRQRVAIARSLVNRPTVILADEPTGSLDTTTRKQILDIIYGYLNEETILIFVTHDLENNRRGEQRVIELRNGQIFEQTEGTIN